MIKKGLGFLGKKKHLTVPTVETKHKGVVTTITTTHKRWVWYKEYEAWKAIGESSLIPNVGSTKRSGITLEGWGWVSPPNPISTSGKASKGTELRPLSCIVRYKHLSMILKGPKGTYGIGTRSVPAGVKPDRKPLGVIGSTGNAPTGGEHLHFEMAIETLGNKADKIYTNTVKAVLKARTEFLTNMLLLKMTKTGGQLKADPKAAASSQLSEAWKKKLRGKIKVKVDGKVTVIDVNKAKAIDVINAMKKSHTITSKFREWFTDADDFIEKGRSKHKRFAVHPLMFFTPEQLVDNPNQKSGRMA